MRRTLESDQDQAEKLKLAFRPGSLFVLHRGLFQCKEDRPECQQLHYKKCCSTLHPGYPGCRIQTMILQGAGEEHKQQSTKVKAQSSLAATRAEWLLPVTPFKSGRFPLAWLDEYGLTYPPSPLAFWLDGKKEQRWRDVRSKAEAGCGPGAHPNTPV